MAFTSKIQDPKRIENSVTCCVRIVHVLLRGFSESSLGREELNRKPMKTNEETSKPPTAVDNPESKTRACLDFIDSDIMNQNEESKTEMDVDVVPAEATSSVKTKSPKADETGYSPYPDMKVAQSIHRVAMMTGPHPKLNSSDAASIGLSPEYIIQVFRDVAGPDVENPSLYRHLKQVVHASSDVLGSFALLSEEELNVMDTKHRSKIASLEIKMVEAKEKAGDTEVLDARFELARFAAKSLTKVEALEAYEKILKTPKLSSGKSMDALMDSARVAIFYGDVVKGEDFIAKTKKIAEDGGDWDRRNKLKVYTALSKIQSRDLKSTAELLVDCIATFSCTELCSFRDFVVYTILSTILHLPRTELKEKIIDGPEILTVAPDIPVVFRLVQALYHCDYKEYLMALVDLHPILIGDRYLQPHCGYIVRELYVLGYKQFLDSYKSVTIESMAKTFGVSPEYLDIHLSRFIAAGRLNAKIDKFGGIVETNRSDVKNAQYKDMIHKGDLLLNRMQKLSRVLDM